MYSVNYDEYDPAAAGEFLTEFSGLVDAGFLKHSYPAMLIGRTSAPGDSGKRKLPCCSLVLPTPARTLVAFSRIQGSLFRINCDSIAWQVLFWTTRYRVSVRTEGLKIQRPLICLRQCIHGAARRHPNGQCRLLERQHDESGRIPFLQMSLQRLAQEVAPWFASELHYAVPVDSIAL